MNRTKIFQLARNLQSPWQVQLLNFKKHHSPGMKILKIDIGFTRAINLQKGVSTGYSSYWHISEYLNEIKLECHYLNKFYIPRMVEYLSDRFLYLLIKLSNHPDKKVAEVI